MAYFKWRGIDLSGTVRSGKLFARSEKDLDSTLLDREIALLSCSNARPRLFSRSITLEVKIHFFRQLAVLLDAGVMLPEALEILGSLVGNIRLREVICGIGVDVQEGLSLSESLKAYPDTFDSLMIMMIRIGQEAGSLGYALEQLGDYLEITQSFRKKLKSASMLPLLTFGFFLLITVSLFVFVVPCFAEIFQSMKKDLPGVTKFIINISKTLRSSAVVFIAIALGFFVVGIRQYMKTVRGKLAVDSVLIRIPWLGDLAKNSSLVYFLHSVSMLLNSGVRLIQAMNISSKAIKNSILRGQVDQLEREVEAGSSLSQSMNRIPGSLFEADLVALAKVGEESGRLGPMLKRGADIYQGKVNRSISFFTTIFQPMLMIILGLMITLLIFAIYLPVFSLSDVV